MLSEGLPREFKGKLRGKDILANSPMITFTLKGLIRPRKAYEYQLTTHFYCQAFHAVAEEQARCMSVCAYLQAQIDVEIANQLLDGTYRALIRPRSAAKPS